MRNRHIQLTTAIKVLALVLVIGPCFSSRAAVKGSGTASDPVTGTAAAGDKIPAGVYVKNLSQKNNARIVLKGNYTANSYPVVFSAEGGSFPNGTSKMEVKLQYGQKPSLPPDPVRTGSVFAGWYLKGNHKADQPSVIGGTILGKDTVYMIASDDKQDLAASDHDSSGKPVARALWRSNTVSLNDGNGPDGPVQEITGDIWDPKHSNNKVIEWIPELPDKAAYRRAHKKAMWQYGRIMLNAETALASSYTWYVKRPGESSFKKLEKTGPSLLLEGLRREDTGSRYRCVAGIGGDGGSVSYETEITVLWLPEIQGTRITDDHKEVKL